MQYELNPLYKDLKKFLLNIRDYFYNSSDTIHKARNEIKIIEYAGKRYVVKSFKKPSFLKSIYYTKKSSKAKRSYEYSLRLGKFAPKPVGYVEFYESNRLKDSYFISEYFEYDYTIATPLRDKSFKKSKEVLEEFAIFSSNLHSRDILHLDFSAGNILVKEDSGKYNFKVVDLNRMKFKKLTLNERLKNFDMLWASSEAMKIIATKYAKINNLDIDYVVKKALFYSFRLKLIKNFKKLIKGKVKNIDW